MSDARAPATAGSKRSMSVLLCAGIVWLGGLAFGLGRVWTYSTTPGTAGVHPGHWPTGSRLAPTPGRPTLVMFAHPHCPCTRASLSELNKILNRVRGAVDAVVVFLRPSGTSDGWEHTETWSAAQRLPGAHVLVDRDGQVAKRFGAETSGQVLFYDATGTLRFAGGITASRGHEGDNIGAQRVLALLGGGRPDRSSADVYGCALADGRRPIETAAGPLAQKQGGAR